MLLNAMQETLLFMYHCSWISKNKRQEMQMGRFY